jgi:hypothetical protein
MATLAGKLFPTGRPQDLLSGTPRAHVIDRWIFVITAAWFIVIVLAGFVPDSVMKIGMVEAGKRPPFPIIMHIHAVVMGTFLLLVLAQTWLMATGRSEYHMRLGVAAFILAPALVVAGFILAPTMYHETWSMLQSAPPGDREKLQALIAKKEDILLVQLRIGLLFPLFLAIGLRARKANAGFHKRMMLLAPAVAISAGIDRITWLPTTMPASYLSIDAFVLLAIAPMFLWDVIRNRRVHEAYWIWIAVVLPVSLLIYRLWDTPWWHTTARHILGVPA